MAVPLTVGAQQRGKLHRIGVFHLGDHSPPGLGTLRQGLAALGYEEGKNIVIDFRNVADEDAARETAQTFVRDRVDVIVAFGNPTIRAARAAINLKTAKALGLTIPPSLLARADQVIE